MNDGVDVSTMATGIQQLHTLTYGLPKGRTVPSARETDVDGIWGIPLSQTLG